jgi:hypothetical protein
MLFVTCVYSIYDAEVPSGSADEQLWSRLRLVEPELPHLHIFHAPGSACPFCARGAVQRQGLVCQHAALEDFPTFKALAGAEALPTQRCRVKDTLRYMQLICSKTDMVAEALRCRSGFRAAAWVDAGIAKVLTQAPGGYQGAVRSMAARAARWASGPCLTPFAPGCWAQALPPSSPAESVVECVNWRWCGGFLCMPAEEAARSARIVCEAAREVVLQTGAAVWEVNVWALAEHRLGWRWYRGDHDETIFDCLEEALRDQEVTARCTQAPPGTPPVAPDPW